MRRRIGIGIAVLAALVLVIGGRNVWVALHVATGYAAKVTCSLVRNSGRESVYRDYVARELTPFSPWLRVTVSRSGVEARAFGVVLGRAIYRPGLGCTLLAAAAEPITALAEGFARERPPRSATAPWPEGDAPPAVLPSVAVSNAIDRAFREPDTPQPGRVRQTTAVVVIHGGQLIAERYAPGYGPDTPMLSWSMAKSVLATLVGLAAADGYLSLREPAPVPEWAAAGDSRHAITLDVLLRMSSGLEFDEHYGAINDVSRMLFTVPDMGAFAAAKALAAPPDTVWSYSSGTSNLIARALRSRFGGDLGALLRYADQRLFGPVGITSAILEPDQSGTPIGSSFVFMTARDWARFGELHRRDGVWNGKRILPEGWVRYVTTPTPAAPDGQYGAHWWLNAGAAGQTNRRMWPGLPTDTYSARGHSGQYVAIVPSAHLVVVRLGLSFPDDGDDGAPELIADLIRALH